MKKYIQKSFFLFLLFSLFSCSGGINQDKNIEESKSGEILGTSPLESSDVGGGMVSGEQSQSR